MMKKITRLTEDQISTNFPEDKFAVSFEDIDNFGNVDTVKRVFQGMNSYQRNLKEGITLINEKLTATIPFTRENLYLFCAYTGSGKSTVAANISYPLWKEGKKTLVITNEESEQDVLLRISCLELGLDFNAYKKGKMSEEDIRAAGTLIPQIAKFVKVIDVNYKDGLTTKIEGIKNALEALRGKDYACAMIDYFQLIKYSVKDPLKSHYAVLDDLRIWLGQYIKSSNIPIVMFVQLYSIGKRNTKDLDARVKHCSSIVEPATVIVEVLPNFETKTSDFMIIKDRFGNQGKRVICKFEKGRFIGIDEHEYKQIEAEAKNRIADAMIEDFNRANGNI